MIAFQAVSKRYGAHRALREVSFSVPRGQAVGLLGQNGAGKSTAMNILCGCLAPSCGSVTVGGYDVTMAPRQAKRLIGYLPEQAPMYDEMTVREYLKFACRLRQVEKRGMDAHLKEVMEKTGLADVAGRKIGNLSKGYRQRVGVAQALCGTPDALILDEPTSGLDPRQSSEMRALIRALAGEHTILFSSHILSEVQQICDRVIILHQGRVVCDRDLRESAGEKKPLRALIACGEQALLPALRSLKSVKAAETERGSEPGLTQVVLTPAAEGEPERELFALLSRNGWPLLRLTPVEDSLEEIFLRVTEREQD